MAPVSALASSIDASLIPDGTYTVKVEKIVDASHIAVAMDNGAETTLSAGRATVDFSKIKPNDQIKCSIVKGAVLVYLDLTSH
jgi:hypothetical protein